jgi:hypothetical protein
MQVVSESRQILVSRDSCLRISIFLSSYIYTLSAPFSAVPISEPSTTALLLIYPVPAARLIPRCKSPPPARQDHVAAVYEGKEVSYWFHSYPFARPHA